MSCGNAAWKLFLVAVVAAGVNGQTTSSSSAAPIQVRSGQLGAISMANGSFAVGYPGGPFQPVTGKPYSAEQVSERSQTLADGTHITETTQKTMFYRDSAGRTRTEHTIMPPGGRSSRVLFIEIQDPVAGYHYTLNENSHEARRSAWPPQPVQRALALNSSINASATVKQTPHIIPPNGSANASGTNSPPLRPRPSDESLGTQTMEGITVEGRRMTTVFPEGFFGNDRPITVVTETWRSPDLNVIVLQKTSDPRSGESTMRLTNLSQTEPDPALFQVPADYSIVEEPQPVPR